MTKIRVSKEEIRAAMHKMGHDVPDFIELEGEVVEEKCEWLHSPKTCPGHEKNLPPLPEELIVEETYAVRSTLNALIRYLKARE